MSAPRNAIQLVEPLDDQRRRSGRCVIDAQCHLAADSAARPLKTALHLRTALISAVAALDVVNWINHGSEVPRCHRPGPGPLNHRHTGNQPLTNKRASFNTKVNSIKLKPVVL